MLLKTLWSLLLTLSLLGNFAVLAQDPRPWWDLIASTFDGTNLKTCFKHDGHIKPIEGPANKSVCSSKPKTCFFQTQDCAGDPYPVTRCDCADSIWQCAALQCPPTDTAAPVVLDTAAPVVLDTAAPVALDTPAPVVLDTSAPVVVDIPVPVVAGTLAPVIAGTPAPVVAGTSAPVVPDTPAPVAPDIPAPFVSDTPAPVIPDTPAPVILDTPQANICPALEALRLDFTCDGTFRCIYTYIDSTDTQFCNVMETCPCTDGQFVCTVESKCQPAPTCDLDAIRVDDTCTTPGFGCLFTYSATVGNEVCTTEERCDCTDAGPYTCVVQSFNCASVPTCPNLAAIQADPACPAAAEGLRCNTTSTGPQNDLICTTLTGCTCSSEQFACAAQTECMVAPTCPTLVDIQTDPTCAAAAEGLGCTFTAVAPDGNGNTCATVNDCTCTSGNFACQNSVTCKPIPDCPTQVEILADPNCPVLGQGCIFQAVEKVEDEVCTKVERCDCGTDGMFVCASATDCVDAPMCPSFEDFQAIKTCSSPGLGCGFSYSNIIDGQLCTFTETCTCTDGLIFDCEIAQSCVPEPTCPSFSDFLEENACTFGGLGCAYTGFNDTGPQTCETLNTCTCNGSEFDCVLTVDNCVDNPETFSCPSFDAFMNDPTKTCPGAPLSCTYSYTQTIGTDVCNVVEKCACAAVGAAFAFDCVVVENPLGCLN